MICLLFLSFFLSFNCLYVFNYFVYFLPTHIVSWSVSLSAPTPIWEGREGQYNIQKSSSTIALTTLQQDPNTKTKVPFTQKKALLLYYRTHIWLRILSCSEIVPHNLSRSGPRFWMQLVCHTVTFGHVRILQLRSTVNKSWATETPDFSWLS